MRPPRMKPIRLELPMTMTNLSNTTRQDDFTPAQSQINSVIPGSQSYKVKHNHTQFHFMATMAACHMYDQVNLIMGSLGE